MGVIKKSKEAVRQGVADIKTGVTGKQHTPSLRQRNAAKLPGFWAEMAAIGREAVKDVRQTGHEVFYGKGEHAAEAGTPLNPTQMMATEELKPGIYGPGVKPDVKPPATSHQQALADAAKRGSNRTDRKGRSR